ncbi:MAG: NfeD family protein [Bdellovibrionales bacterium]|nr:NfeD family protein [Bdellovibrionales bacterium]
MEQYIFWIILGAIFMLLEFIVPGGIVVFLGLAAAGVGVAIYFGLLHSVVQALIAWFIISLFLILFLRAFFMKFFEGDQSVANVDEDDDLIGSIVYVTISVFPYKDGRVKFRETTWTARSEEEILEGSKALIKKREGNVLIIKSI